MKIKEHEENQAEDDSPTFPRRKNKDGFVDYTFDYLKDDQKELSAIVIQKIKEFMTCKDLQSFKPLRMTVMGAGGSGKSVVINTLVTLMRKMFTMNKVAMVAAPTGTSAFNVGGETLHHLTASAVTKGEYKPHQLRSNKNKRKKLIKKFRSLLFLAIDERSLIGLKDIGTASTLIAETIYEGGPFPNEDFRGLPVLLLFGDDYQLPSIKTGAFSCLEPPQQTGKMTLRGREVMLKAATDTWELKGSKRIMSHKLDDKRIMERIRRQKEITEPQITKLMNLSIKSFEARNGKEKTDALKAKSICLSFRNKAVDDHNIRQLEKCSSQEKPVAIIRTKTHGHLTGKADSRHFDTETPPFAKLCIDAIVAIAGRNFQPLWGLHNGACGKVVEIVFEKDCNPNNGDMPECIVVEFPLHCGPAWDMDNPCHVPIPVIEHKCKKPVASDGTFH